MKHLLCVLALTVPCLSMAAVFSMPAAPSSSKAGNEPAGSAHHHPLIEVKFVLVRPPTSKDEGPYFDFGNGQPAIRALPWWSGYSMPLGPHATDPNMYWCSGWVCRDSHY